MDIQINSFKDICRICMKKTNFLFPIFGRIKYIPEKILYCAKIKVDSEDELPSQICKICIQNLEVAYKFKKLCKQSDTCLRGYLTSKRSKCSSILTNQDQVKQKNIASPQKATIETKSVNITDPNEELSDPQIPVDTNRLTENEKQTDELTKCINNGLYICEKCGKSFDTHSGLKGHIKRHDDVRPFKCKECPKSFKENGSLKVHMRNHTGERPYSCEFCSSSFTQKSVLKNHIRSHTKEMPFKCELCGRSFTAASNIAKHLAGHRNERKYACNLCDAAFNFSSGLKKHLLSHTDERPFSCTVCNKGFKRKTNLTLHMRIHSDEMPYTCEICSKSFRYNSILKNHLHSKHDVIVLPLPTLANYQQ